MPIPPSLPVRRRLVRVLAPSVAAFALLAAVAGFAWRAEPADADAGFAAAAELEFPPTLRSAPELSRLEGVGLSGVPLRLRLFVDAGGQVVGVRLLAGREDGAALVAVREMFEAVAFAPGRRDGAAVAAFTDIELAVRSP